MLNQLLKNMNKIKISVIIPIYNGEKHIDNCVKSLQNQTLKELEFIFINDGSTDNSLTLLKSYENDPRIKILSQENKGVSAARNLGIKHATGEYIGFLDVDDEHKPDMYLTLYSVAETENVDIVISNILLERDNKWVSKKSTFLRTEKYYTEEINQKIIPYILGIEDLVLMIVSNKIYKNGLIKNNDVFFNESLKLDEDTLFNLKALFYSNSIKFIDFDGYYYKNNEDSVTRDFLKNNIFEQNILKYKIDLHSYLPLDISESELIKMKSSRFIYNIVFLIFKAAINKSITKKQRNDFVVKIIKNETVKSAITLLHSDYVAKMGKFEKFIVFCVRKQNIKLALMVTTILSYLYSAQMSEFIRKFNK